MLNLNHVRHVQEMAADPHVGSLSAWDGFKLDAGNGWTRDYVVSLLSMAPELLELAATTLEGRAKASELLDTAIEGEDATSGADHEYMQARRGGIVSVMALMTGQDETTIYEAARERMIARREVEATREE